ncbi:uncharacterized protein LAESUDRAFT_682971 [Laetiporus sulphureus 93-53]|uniref:Uncharacterized protein n=1 Tax=Laetiporus sulphureus 93-53 TaxID=1314785 RepID=A0A165D661_9APHY|nr:uncharacterized protein LAESUDRAFT_682971 [Laetiporus sulphureus 93-53]KZT04223.1 hypothetical protein LAESUDRAFT_682971 [Laetiporus sulphureus 93-53]
MRPPEDRRLAPPPPAAVDRQSRPVDDRRAPPPASLAGDRQVRPVDDRRPLPPPSIDRRPLVDDRRPLPPVDRPMRPSDDRRPPSSEDRNARGPTGPPPVMSRPPVEDRSIRPPPSKDDLSTRPPALLEERIGRAPPSRLTEKYPSEERGYGRDLERGRYPPVDAPPSTYSRVRPRSPSPPPRRSGPVDDLRPPMKRARDDYGPEYFTPAPPVSDTRAPPPADYPPRVRSPVASGSAYYDSRAPPAYGSSPGGLPRERDYPDARDRPEYPAYDRRVPTARRSASPYPRYPRDDRRYGVHPRG